MVDVRDAAIQALLGRARREVDEGVLPSCQLALARGGELLAFETYGDATNENRYVIFSCTKTFVASVVWMLLSEGRLHLADRIADHIPEFGGNGKSAVTLEQVLLHTSGFPGGLMNPVDWNDRNVRLAAFARWRLEWEPGTMYRYHGLSGHWVLAELIERATGEDYRGVLRSRVQQPLGLRRFALGVPLEEQSDIVGPRVVGEPATTEQMQAAWGVQMPPVSTHGALPYFAAPENLEVGVPAANGVSTAADVSLFYQGLLHSDLWDRALVADMTRVHNAMPDELGVICTRGLGVQVNGDDGYGTWFGFGRTNSPAAFGHDGAGGMIAWADPSTGLSFCYLTNGLDENLVRQKRRGVGLSSRAAVCTG
jgi:CubicO group peptidase (beta-lactamase class C family)